MPGKPDIVFRKYKTVVFVNGCFWHHHNCDRFKWPTSNVEYWIPKIERNVQRDIDNKKLLEANGWRVLVIWECELKKKIREKNLQSFYKSIVEGGDNKC